MLTCKETTTLATNIYVKWKLLFTYREDKILRRRKCQSMWGACAEGAIASHGSSKDPQSDGSGERQQQRLSALSFFVDSGAHTTKTAGQDGGLGGPCCSCPPPCLVPLGLVLLLPSLDQLLARTAREATFCQGVCCPGSGDKLPFTTWIAVNMAPAYRGTEEKEVCSWISFQ